MDLKHLQGNEKYIYIFYIGNGNDVINVTE